MPLSSARRDQAPAVPWAADDFHAVQLRPAPLDFWLPTAPPPLGDERLGAGADDGTDAVRSPAMTPPPPVLPGAWFWSDAVEQPATPLAAVANPFGIDLPRFDPGATTARPLSTLLDGRFTRSLALQARMLAEATAIVAPDRRARAARLFRDALEEGRWPKLFERWLTLAPEIASPDVLALTLELRAFWEDETRYWLHRHAPGRCGSFQPGARGHMSWRRALAMASARPELPAEALLTDDLVTE